MVERDFVKPLPSDKHCRLYNLKHLLAAAENDVNDSSLVLRLLMGRA